MTYPPGPSRPAGPLVRPPGWLPDPLDDALVRYWDGHRWTFRTAVHRAPAYAAAPAQMRPAEQPSPPPPTPALHPDVARALERVRGALVGSMKEVNLLGGYLGPEEEVLALTGAQGEGMGVLACTNHRVLFLFVGLVVVAAVAGAGVTRRLRRNS